MILQADARHIPLQDESVQTVVTSPPYWGLRDYGIAPQVWGSEDPCCGGPWPFGHEWGDERIIPADDTLEYRRRFQSGRKKDSSRRKSNRFILPPLFRLARRPRPGAHAGAFCFSYS